jgi:DNA-binding transcriptional ArsR family regulator
MDSNRAILNRMVQYPGRLDSGFGALSDPTRRGILLHLAKEPASITELAGRFDMTLTGMKKHVHVLEDAGLVVTKKAGRVRTVSLGPRRLDDEVKWIESYRTMLNERLNSLEAFLERTRDAK